MVAAPKPAQQEGASEQFRFDETVSDAVDWTLVEMWASAHRKVGG